MDWRGMKMTKMMMSPMNNKCFLCASAAVMTLIAIISGVKAHRSGRRDDLFFGPDGPVPRRDGWSTRTASAGRSADVVSSVLASSLAGADDGGNKYHKDPALSDPRFLDRKKYNFNYHLKSRRHHQQVVDNRSTSWLDSSRRRQDSSVADYAGGGAGRHDEMSNRPPFSSFGSIDADRRMSTKDRAHHSPVRGPIEGHFQGPPAPFGSGWDLPIPNRHVPIDVPVEEVPSRPIMPNRQFNHHQHMPPSHHQYSPSDDTGDRRMSHDRFPAGPQEHRRYFYAPSSEVGASPADKTRGRKFGHPTTGRYPPPTSSSSGKKEPYPSSGSEASDYFGDTNVDMESSFFDPLPHSHGPEPTRPASSDRKTTSNIDKNHDSTRRHQHQHQQRPSQQTMSSSSLGTDDERRPTKADVDQYLDEFHRLLFEHEEQVRRQQEQQQQKQQQQQDVGSRRRFHGDLQTTDRRRIHGTSDKPDFDRRPPWFRESSASGGGGQARPAGGDSVRRPSLLGGQMEDLIGASSDSFFLTAPSNVGVITQPDAARPSAPIKPAPDRAVSANKPSNSLQQASSLLTMTTTSGDSKRTNRLEDLPGLLPSLTASTPDWTSLVKWTTPTPSIRILTNPKPTSIYPELNNTTSRRNPNNSRRLGHQHLSFPNFDATKHELELLPALEDILNHVGMTASGTPVIDPSKVPHDIWSQIRLQTTSKDETAFIGKDKKPNYHLKDPSRMNDFSSTVTPMVTTSTTAGSAFVSSTVHSIFNTTPRPTMMASSMAPVHPVTVPTSVNQIQQNRPKYWSEKYGGIVVSPEDEFAILSNANLPGWRKYLANARPIITGPSSSGLVPQPMVTKTANNANPVTFISSQHANADSIFSQGQSNLYKNSNENKLPHLYDGSSASEAAAAGGSSSMDDRRSFGSGSPFMEVDDHEVSSVFNYAKPVEELPMAFQPYSENDESSSMHDKPPIKNNEMAYYDHTQSSVITTTTESYPTIFTTSYKPLSQMYAGPTPSSTTFSLHPASLPPIVTNVNQMNNKPSNTMKPSASEDQNPNGSSDLHNGYKVPSFNTYFGGDSIAGNPFHGGSVQLADLYSEDPPEPPMSIYGPYGASLFKSHDPTSTSELTAAGADHVPDAGEESYEELLQQLGIGHDDSYAQKYDGYSQHLQSNSFGGRANNASSLINVTVAEQLFGNTTQGMTQAQKVAAAIGLGIVPSMVALFPLLFFGRRRRRRRSVDAGQMPSATTEKSSTITNNWPSSKSKLLRALNDLDKGISEWGLKGEADVVDEQLP